MNYQEFLKYKEEVLKNDKIINLAENNLYEVLKEFKPKNLTLQERAYRCHVAEDFLKKYKLNENWKKYLSITKGVRHSLTSLFPLLKNWIIPKDQYPFYNEELRKSTSIYYDYKSINSELTFDKNGTLLITYPKKLGEYSKKELDSLKSWINNPNNTLVIDMVYWLGDLFPAEILELYSTNKVILLYSFSKKFLIPNHVGFNLLPQNSFGEKISNELNKLDKDEDRLKIAQSLLREDNFSYRIKEELWRKGCELNKKGFNFKIDKESPKYLFYREESPESFLKIGLLVIPESVFGGKGSGSIVSSLLVYLI